MKQLGIIFNKVPKAELEASVFVGDKKEIDVYKRQGSTGANIRVHNLAGLVIHLHLLLGVIVRSHLVNLWNDIVCQLTVSYTHLVSLQIFCRFFQQRDECRGYPFRRAIHTG